MFATAKQKGKYAQAFLDRQEFSVELERQRRVNQNDPCRRLSRELLQTTIFLLAVSAAFPNA